MPLDAICLAAVRNELTDTVVDQKIDKVFQPGGDFIILALRGKTGSGKLLISAGASDARIHLTKHIFENPSVPPMFCMLLRKYLTGAKITAISQPPVERVIDIKLEAPDAMGVFSQKRLIIELVARKANIILLDNDGIIIDCLRRIGGELNDKRAVLPGLFYMPPDAQSGKANPTALQRCDWQNLFTGSANLTVDKWLISTFAGLSPLICRELSFRAYGDTDISIDAIKDGGQQLEKEFFFLMDNVRAQKFEPNMIFGTDDIPIDFSYTSVFQYENTYLSSVQANFNAMLDSFYTKKAQSDRAKQRASATVKAVKTAHGRVARKLASQFEELKKTSERELLRENGDIITANLHIMQKGQEFLIADDFYSETEGATRNISLDPLKTPQQNAAKYYKNYTKAKNAEKYLTEQISLGERELDYLESVLETLAIADTDSDLAEIRAELTQTGYFREKKSVKKQKKDKTPAPMSFVSSSGVQILAGRNNLQNEMLTLKTAAKGDMWLHTQKIHGSHVVIKSSSPDNATLNEAATIAAYFSAARNSGKVSVDYTLVKNVKKIPGGRPGMVTYTNYKTILATPDYQIVEKLKAKS